MRRFLNSIFISLISIMVFGLTLSPALAHTSLIASVPADGAKLETFPRTVTLEFSEPLLTLGREKSNYFQVFNPVRIPVELESLRVDGSMMSATLKPKSAEQGRYEVRYRAISGDGHVIRGSIEFTVESGPVSESSTPIGGDSKSDDPLPNSRIVLGTLLLLALIAGLSIYLGAGRRDSDQL